MTHTDDVVSVCDVKIPAAFVYEYLKTHHYCISKVDINSLINNNILPHWCAHSISINNIQTYDYLSILDMADHCSRLKNVSITKPIILLGPTHVVDGTHRLIKCLQLKRNQIKAYILTVKDFDSILNAYKQSY